MGANLHKLPIKHISKAADEIVEYIQKRRKGETTSLKTRWEKFNNLCMGGIEPNAIYTVGGISGSGKSSFISTLIVDLFDLNPKTDFVVLSLNFEMLSSKVVGRKISYKLNKPVQILYSGKSKESDMRAELSEEDFEKVKKEAEKVKQFPIYYADIAGSVEQIKETILNFMENEGKDKWIIITLDHTLLVKGFAERETLSNLENMFMEIKKLGQNTIIQLTQLNRSIEDSQRTGNPSLQFPTRKDIFGSDVVFHTSDYVMVLHNPEMLHIKTYGPDYWDTKGMIYLHILKNREGESKIIRFHNRLSVNRLDEYNPLDSSNF